MTKLNLQNRTLAIMDNLPFLRSLNNECIDLIAIDPPFAANETFTGNPRPPITDAELQEEIALAQKHGVKHDEGRGTTVRDIWTWDDNVHPGWLNMIEDDYPPVFAVIKAVEVCASENEAAYIAFMAVRLIECRRVLKTTGSIYVHCDDHANGYLRMLMDAVFGQDQFRNEIRWRRHTSSQRGSQHQPKSWGNTLDTILFYGKSDAARVDPFRELTEDEAKAKFKLVDENGRRYYDDSAHIWRTPNMGARPNLCYEWRGYTNPHPSGWRLSKERLEEEYQKGNIVILPNGRLQRRKYQDEFRGTSRGNLWTDVNPASGHERTGYATQKPLALYERIIAASSNPGDVVLDIFAGCATTAVAAERLRRHWIACDIAYRSWTMLKRRFALKGYALSDMTSATADALDGEQPELTKATSFTIGPNNLPVRDDEDPDPFHNLQKVKRPNGGQARSARSASWSGRIPKEEAKELLVKQFGAYCWGCGWEAPRFPSGEYDLGLLEVDHIRARRPEDGQSGGSDELYNLALLHATCNRSKGNRMTLEELRRHNADAQRIYGELVPLHEAVAFAAEHIARYGRQEELIG